MNINLINATIALSFHSKGVIIVAKNKVTMRDIAKECNVSVATVSYVLNHNDKVKISHDTFLNVTRAATRLHYVPSPYHASNAGRKTNLVGIFINLKEQNSQSKLILYYDLAVELIQKLGFKKFDAVLIPTKNLNADVSIITKRNFDAVFMIDIDNANVQKATRDYFIPIIFLYCDVPDSLFYKIYPNYNSIIEKSKYMLECEHPYIIMDDIYSQDLKTEITKNFNARDVFINDCNSNLELFLKSHINRKGIVLGDALAIKVSNYANISNYVAVSNYNSSDMLLHEPKKLFVRNSKIADTAIETLLKMINFELDLKEKNRILIDCEFE